MKATTRILDATKEADLFEAVSLLSSDRIVALPTETVYGLAANALSASAVAKIFTAKERPKNNPLIWHVHNLEAAKKLFNFADFCDQSKRRFNLLAQAFWPGPLTMVGAKSNYVNNINLETIAVRIPRSEITLRILSLLDFPLVMPSANISSRPSPTSSNHVLKTLFGRIDAVLDAGFCEVGIESSVIRIDQDEPRILRPGSITKTALEKILGEKVLCASHTTSKPELESPGLAFKHYAPQVAKIILIKASKLKTYWQTGATIIACSSDINNHQSLQKRSKSALTIALPNQPEDFAKSLYGALYKAEEYPLEELILVLPKGSENNNTWAGVYDRLKRSAGYEL